MLEVELKASAEPVETLTGGSPGEAARSSAALRREREESMEEAVAARLLMVLLLPVALPAVLLSTFARMPRHVLPCSAGNGSAAITTLELLARPSRTLVGRDRDSTLVREVRAVAAPAALFSLASLVRDWMLLSALAALAVESLMEVSGGGGVGRGGKWGRGV